MASIAATYYDHGVNDPTSIHPIVEWKWRGTTPTFRSLAPMRVDTGCLIRGRSFPHCWGSRRMVPAMNWVSLACQSRDCLSNCELNFFFAITFLKGISIFSCTKNSRYFNIYSAIFVLGRSSNLTQFLLSRIHKPKTVSYLPSFFIQTHLFSSFSHLPTLPTPHEERLFHDHPHTDTIITTNANTLPHLTEPRYPPRTLPRCATKSTTATKNAATTES